MDIVLEHCPWLVWYHGLPTFHRPTTKDKSRRSRAPWIHAHLDIEVLSGLRVLEIVLFPCRLDHLVKGSGLMFPKSVLYFGLGSMRLTEQSWIPMDG